LLWEKRQAVHCERTGPDSCWGVSRSSEERVVGGAQEGRLRSCIGRGKPHRKVGREDEIPPSKMEALGSSKSEPWGRRRGGPTGENFLMAPAPVLRKFGGRIGRVGRRRTQNSVQKGKRLCDALVALSGIEETEFGGEGVEDNPPLSYHRESPEVFLENFLSTLNAGGGG